MSSDIKCNQDKYSHLVDERRNLFGFDLIEMNLPFEVYDDEDIIEFFNKQKLVPYSGTVEKSGDNLLEFYNDMAEFSPTSSACIASKKSMFFSNKLNVVKASDSTFEFEEEQEELSVKKKKKYADFLNSIDYGRDGNFRNFSANNYNEAERNGNMWVEVEMFMVGRDRYIKFRRHEQKHVRFRFTKSNDREVEISWKWDADYIRDHPTRVLQVYPNATIKKGVFRTMVHESMTGNFWYGRPPSKGSLLHQYSEYQNIFYLCRQVSKDFLSKVIMEVEDDAPANNRLVNNKRDQQAGYKSTLDRFEKRFTNASKNPSTFILMTRPVNSKPMFVHEIASNTNERFYEKIGKINETKIIQSHNWSNRLLGGDAVSLFSTGVYMDELKVKDVTTNLYYQNKMHGFLDKLINLAATWANVEIEDMTFGFQSPYINVLKNEKLVYDKYGIEPIDDETNLVKQGNVNNGAGNPKVDASTQNPK